jgi:ADP-heptose:LPS heptosyltransferase
VVNERGNSLLRALDRWAGIPLAAFLGLGRLSKRPAPRGVRRAAFLKTAAIGDTVFLSALAADLREAFPGVHVTLFTGGSNRDAAALLPGVDRVVELPVRNPIAAARRVLAEGEFDVWIDGGQWPRLDAVLTALARARFKIGFRTAGQHRHWVYDAAVPHSPSVHELENYRNLLRPLGAARGNRPAVDPGGPSGAPAGDVVHMVAGGSKPHLKEWPEDRWRAVVNGLLRRGLSVVLTGTAADRDRAEALRRGVERPEGVRVAAGEMDLRETARLLKASRLLVSVNTGILHLGAAVGCPVVALNGPTSSKRWGPVAERTESIQSPLECSPCLNLGFDYGCPVNDCMKAISAEAVLERVDRLLGRAA